MVYIKKILVFGIVLLVGCSSESQESSGETPSSRSLALSSAQLVMHETEVKADEAISGQLVIKLAEGWHTYSDPPGDSGMAPIITFTLPDGWSAEVLSLPEAETFEDAGGVTFGYEERLPVDFLLKVPSSAVSGSKAEINISIQYLICKDVCLPRSADLRTVLIIK